MVFINLLCTLLSWFNVNFGTLKKRFTNTLPNQRITWQLHCNHEFSCPENLFCSVEFTENINKIFSWCVFVRASLRICREEKPTRCHWMVYCTYNILSMFQALLCPSGARDYMCVIIAYGVQCLVASCRGSGAEQQAMCLGRGMLHATSLSLDT